MEHSSCADLDFDPTSFKHSLNYLRLTIARATCLLQRWTTIQQRLHDMQAPTIRPGVSRVRISSVCGLCPVNRRAQPPSELAEESDDECKPLPSDLLGSELSVHFYPGSWARSAESGCSCSCACANVGLPTMRSCSIYRRRSSCL